MPESITFNAMRLLCRIYNSPEHAGTCPVESPIPAETAIRKKTDRATLTDLAVNGLVCWSDFETSAVFDADASDMVYITPEGAELIKPNPKKP